MREGRRLAGQSGAGRGRHAGWLVVCAAVLMGLPTLRGRFVGGDDHRLVLDHVLVSRPSWSHAAQLLGMVHRDLYQPLPLLSFSAEFAVLKALGLRADVNGPGGGAWLFHLTNVLLHALNAWLVWRLIRRLHGDWRVAACAGVLFAVHPLQVEAVAWVNGRMMLMSTLFVLLTLLAWARFVAGEPRAERTQRGSGDVHTKGEPRASARADAPAASVGSRWTNGPWALGAVVLVCVAAAMMSKVRVSLPILMAVVALASQDLIAARSVRTRRISAQAQARSSPGAVMQTHASGSSEASDDEAAWACWLRPPVLVLWVLAAVVTAGFTWLNVSATAESDMFLQGGQKLAGPRVARAVIALAWYLTHVVWPVGLSAWYAPIDIVAWTDARTVWSLAIVIPLALAVALSIRWTRVGWYGSAWFLASIASTLPLIPSRNLLAADRYMYLPIIGLLWIIGAGAVSLWCRLNPRATQAGDSSTLPDSGGGSQSHVASPWLARGAATAVVLVLLATSWKTSGYYLDSVAKMSRNLAIHPDLPNMHAKLGWAHLQSGDAERGLELGREELRLHAGETADEAWQLIGLSQLQLGEPDAAVEALRNAVAAAPDNKQARYRLASALADAGRDDEALAAFDEVIPQLPKFNPGLYKAAGVYRRNGRRDDARRLYQQILADDNNPFDIYAPVALAEMDMEDGDYEAAATRLAALLAWYPEHAAAAANLGVSFAHLGRPDDALSAYRHALDVGPHNAGAWLNMALLLASGGRAAEAEQAFLRACDASGGALDVLVAAHRFYLEVDRPDRAVDLWRAWTSGGGVDRRRQVWLAWAQALSGDVAGAAGELEAATARIGAAPAVESNREAEALLQAAAALLAVARQAPTDLVAAIDRLTALPEAQAATPKAELLDATMWYGERHPQQPWPYLAAGMLLADDGRAADATAGFEAFLQLCEDERWRAFARDRMAAAASTPGG